MGTVMHVRFNDLEARVLRYIEQRLIEHGNPTHLSGKVLLEQEVIQEFGLTETDYRRLITRFESLGLVNVIAPGAVNSWIKIDNSIVEVVRQLDDAPTEPAPKPTAKPEAATGSNPARPLVISLHGINTRGDWQKKLTRALNEADFNYEPLDYGDVKVWQFMREKVREDKVDWFREQYTAVTNAGAIKPSIIAHSFGTYILTRAMEKYDLRFDRIILCGSIVRRDYPWTARIGSALCQKVLNDFGKQDWASKLAEYVVKDAGRSGSKGFDDLANGNVVDRAHADFGHSTYFYELNYKDNWIPFLKGGLPRPLSTKKKKAFNFRYYAFRIIIWLLLAAVFCGSIWWFWPSISGLVWTRPAPFNPVTFVQYRLDVLANENDQGKLTEFEGKSIEWDALVVSVDQLRRAYRIVPIPERNEKASRDVEVYAKATDEGFSEVVTDGDLIRIKGVIDKINPNGTRLRDCEVVERKPPLSPTPQ
jgi:pimeloyl-ACP methyl ester carboxylesterase